MGIVDSVFSRGGRKQEETADSASVATMSPEVAMTKLILLMPDASGITTYHLHTFVTGRQAEDYLDSILRGDVQEGTIMFWGLTWRPEENGHRDVEAEPVVLIRDPSRPGLVYTFSFVNMDSAYDFVRHEMKAGLDLSQTAIFWAVPAEATADTWGQITVSPGRPPIRERALSVDTADSEPEPSVTTSYDEPNGTQPDVDPPSAVRLPELNLDEPEAAEELEAAEEEPEILSAPKLTDPEPTDEPEAVADEPETAEDEPETLSAPGLTEPEAADAPARKAIDDADISNVSDILEARGLRAPSRGPQPNDEPNGTTDDAVASAENGNGSTHNGDETIHVDLTDVFGGRRDPETVTTLEDFRRRRDIRHDNGFHDAEPLIEAESETSPGIIAAWSNIVAAIDRAIGAYVARRVSFTICWRRLTCAFVAAANVRLLVTWRTLAQALAAAAAAHAEQGRGVAQAWINIARALRQAAESKSGRRAKRLAWANISWTLEEAVYAARLQRKRAAMRVWANATEAIAVAAIKDCAIQRGLSTAWRRLAAEALSAAEAQKARHARVTFAWTSIGRSLFSAVEAKYRHQRVVFAWSSTGIALSLYAATKQRHDGLVAAWNRLAAAIEEAAEATARRNGVIRAWRLLALETLVAADSQVRHEAAVNAWANVSRAVFDGAAAKVRFDGLVAAWGAASSALGDFADAQMRHNGAISAWHELSCAIADGAASNLEHQKLVRAWQNASRALLNAAQAQLVRQMAYRQSWQRLTTALLDAADASQRRDAARAAWHAIADAFGDAVMARVYQDRCVATWDAVAIAIADALPIRIRELAARQAWNNAMLALKEATVAEAQVRIAQAGLDNDGFTVDEQAAAIEMWRFRESGRFGEKKVPFDSFDSPPGRF